MTHSARAADHGSVPADMFIADVGDEHVAHPVGQARILVIERKGSI